MLKNKNFKLVKREKLKDIQSEYFEFEYLPLGTKIIWIKNKDQDRAFEIAFRTPPTNDKGINHILEHSVLRGSRKYPFQKEEVFSELAKKSSYTFLNAVTYPDKTVYPFSSNQEKSFFQILDVYLDAVFFPRVLEDKNIFKQEGWRYDIDENGKIFFNGVVFNEMKGRYSDINGDISNEQTKNLFPDTVYRFEYGGEPSEIFNLTYEELVDYHKKYYHPSNSLIYFYGDLKIEKILDYLEKEFLSHFNKKKINSKIKLQKKIKERIYKKKKYFSNNLDENILSLNFVVSKIWDFEKNALISALNNLLFLDNQSVLKKKLLETGLVSKVESHLETDIGQVFWEINLKGVKKNDLKKLEKKFWEFLNEIIQEGFDERDIELEIKRWERSLYFKTLIFTGKGLGYGDIFAKYWNYDVDNIQKIFELKRRVKELKEKVSQKNIFEKFIKEIFLKNQHSLILELIADNKIDNEKDLKKKLEKINKISQKNKEKILTEIKEFQDWQKIQEPEENLALIKSMKKTDFPKSVKKLDYKKINKNHLFEKTKFAITSTNLFFDTSYLDDEEYQYLELVLRFLNQNEYHFKSLGKKETIYQRKKIFERFGLEQFFDKDKKGGLLRKLVLDFNILSKDRKKAFEFLNLFFNEIVLNEESFERIVNELKLIFKESIAYSGQNLAYTKNLAGLSKKYYLKNKISGIDFIDFLNNLDKKEALGKMEKIYHKIFNKNNLIISELSNKEDREIFNLLKLSDEKFSEAEINFESGREKLAVISDSLRNSFNSLSLKIEDRKISSEKYHILLSNLKYDYLWKKIREEGGAYGATAFFDEKDSLLIFVSWMDSRIDGTYEDFLNLVNYLENKEFSNEEIENLIVKELDRYWKPRTILFNSGFNFYNEFVRTVKREKEYKNILNFKKKDIPLIVDEMKKSWKNTSFVSLTNSDSFKKSKILKDKNGI